MFFHWQRSAAQKPMWQKEMVVLIRRAFCQSNTIKGESNKEHEIVRKVTGMGNEMQVSKQGSEGTGEG